MSDLTKSNLEPIEEGDLGLKEKFIGGGEAEKKSDGLAQKETVPLKIPGLPEQPERKEGAVEKEAAYSKILSKVSAAQPVIIKSSEISDDAQNVNEETDAQSKIQNLVNLATTKSIAHAVKVARHLEDNYVLDEFHDRLLSEELHDALVKKGLIHPV